VVLISRLMVVLISRLMVVHLLLKLEQMKVVLIYW
jgi:hypothetical protein